MTTLPTVGKDANGMPIVVGVTERQLTQNQADYSDIYKGAQLISTPEAANLRAIMASNPQASAGLVTSLAKAGALPQNSLVKTMADIDAQTRADRAAATKKAADKASTDKFNQSDFGIWWRGFKTPFRWAAAAGNSVLETITAPARIAKNDLKQKNPWLGDTGPSLDFWRQFGKQLTMTQIAGEALKTGHVTLGSGFFPSEEVGAGFAARAEQMKLAKVAIVKDGKTVGYRPYTLWDPATQFLPGGSEGGAARFFNAVGDIGLSFATDPTLAYGKLAQGAKDAELALQGAKGVVAAKTLPDIVKANAAKEALAQAEKDFQASVDALHAAQAEKTGIRAAKADYKASFNTVTGLRDKYGNIQMQYNDIANFISGPAGQHIIDGIANNDSWQAIRAMSKNQLTVKEAVALSKASTREEVLSVIAPFISSGSVIQRSLETGTLLGNKLSRAVSEIVPGSGPSVLDSLKGAAAQAAQRTGYTQAIAHIGAIYDTHIPQAFKKVVEAPIDYLKTMPEKYNTFIPEKGGSLIHVAATDKLVDTVASVGRYVKLDEPVLNNLLDKIALAGSDSKAGYTATAELFNAIYKQYESKFSGEQLKAFKDATRVFKKEAKDTASYWASRHATGTDINFGFIDGKPITLHSSHLDSELLNSFVFIPSGEDIIKMISSVNKFKKFSHATMEMATQATGMWKKTVLVRPAYISRNILEEQIRVFGTGHASFLNSPLSAMAMFLGREGGPKWQELLNKLDEVRHDVYGNNFKMSSAKEEFAAETLAGDNANDYVAFLAEGNMGVGSDGELNKILTNLGYQKEVYGHPLWWEGFASQIRILHNSDFVKQVLKTKPGQEMKTINYFLKGKGRPTLDRFLESKQQEFKDFANTPDGLKKFLFTGIDDQGRAASVAARIDELAGAGEAAPLIRQLLAKGSITLGKTKIDIPKGEHIAENALANSKQISKGKKGVQEINKILAENFQKAFDGKGNWENVRLTVPKLEFSRTTDKMQGLEKIAANFFQTAVKLEKLTTMGPEWRQSYWDAIHGIAGAIDSKGLAKLQETAKKSLSPLRNPITGNNVGLNHKVWDSISRATGDGPMNLDEAHQYAVNVANKKVANLFYDASKRRLLFHQLRLVAPFAQAWADTLHAWGKIAMDNPLQVYKGVKVLDFLNKKESGAFYEIAPDTSSFYDPNQGFFYTDPRTGGKQMFIPFASAGMNWMRSLLPGGEKMTTSGPLAMSANPASLNFAIGNGSVVPGVGPGLSISAAMLDAIDKNPLKLLPASLEDQVNQIIFPYGKPNIKKNGILDAAFLTGNWARIFGSIANQEAAYASAFAPSMTYLANSGAYNLDNPEEQNKLIKDANNLARWSTMWRGITGAVSPLPVALQPNGLAKSKDGNLVLAASLWADFKNMEVAAGSRPGKAYADFLDTYGPEQVFAIVSTTTGGAPTNLMTYELIKKDPSVMDKYPDVYGYLYPNGLLSQSLYNWQQQQGNFTNLSAKEIMNQATNIRFNAAEDRLMARSIGEGWSASQYKAARTELANSYANRNRVITVEPYKNKQIMNQLKAAAYDTRFVTSDAATGLRDYLYLRDAALAAAPIKGDSLKNAASAPQREWLAQQALTILQKHPEFQKLYYSFFKTELEG